MKRIGIIALTLASLNAYAQSDSQPTFKKIQLGVSFSPDMNYRTLTAEDNVQFIKDIRNENEVPVFGYTTGLDAVFNFTEMFSIQTGIHYSMKGFQNVWDDAFYPIQPNDPNIPAAWKSIDKFHYLDIPVRANITVGKRKVRFIGSLGLVVNVYMASEQVLLIKERDGDISKNVTKEPYDYEKVNLSPTVSAGVAYRINDLMTLRAEPTFSYGVLKTTNTPVTAYLWNAGLKVSYLFGLW